MISWLRYSQNEGIIGIGETDANSWATKAYIDSPGTHYGFGSCRVWHNSQPNQSRSNIQDAANPPDFMRRVQKEIPLKRMGEASEVANLAVFLASKESDYVTAAEIIIDGALPLYPFTI